MHRSIKSNLKIRCYKTQLKVLGKLYQRGFLQSHFSVRPIFGHTPLTVYFTDHSRSHSKVLYWAWNFGDRKISSLKNPVHVYKRPGRYTVSLKLRCPYGVTDTKRVFITLK